MEKERLARQRRELIAVHAVILAGLLLLTGVLVRKAFTPATVENTVRHVVAFDRYEPDRYGRTNLYAGETCYRVPFDAPGLSAVLADCGTGMEYEVYVRHVSASEGSDYERVFALNAPDGTACITFEESSADERQQGLLLSGCMGATVVIYIFFAAASVRRYGGHEAVRGSKRRR